MFSALRYSNFRWFWLNGATQAMGQGMQFLTIGILVLDSTDSSYQLGLVIFAYGVPNLAFSLVGGIIADRTDRLRLLVSTRVVESGLLLALAILKLSGVMELWHVFAVSALLGTVQAINGPTRMALVADLVDRKDLMNAVALHTMVNQSGQIIGPALAGGVIEIAGVGNALVANAAMYLFGIAFLVLIKGLVAMPEAPKKAVIRELREGLQCVRSTPVLYTVIGLALAFTFFGMSYRQVLPAFTKEVLDVGAGGTGLLWLGAGLGSLLGSFLLASLGDFKRKSWLLLASLLLLCVFLIAFAWSPWYWISWILFFFVGTMSTGLFWPLANTLVQLNVPSELRGRVLSILQIAPAIHFLSALPLAVAGGLVSWPIAVTGVALMVLLVTLLLGIWRPTLRRFEG
ncbi:MAG: MFS transporter [Dehalococcoidia bacterium]|jgi:MFS family permease|nr:MFS transporter [Dehalococcoidia bacterium]|tara:strand:+ start:8175 stop:9377 length:1203 start_codon:yes stop_codon:yes gene_type:complete